MDIGERVRTARKQAKLTQKELAKLIKGKQSVISDIENGKNRTSSSLYDIALATKVDPNWLLKGEGDMLSAKPNIDRLQNRITAIMVDGESDPKGTQRLKNNIAYTVPIISWVAAGSWSDVEPVTLDDAKERVPAPPNLSKRGFALRVVGRSMWPEFKPGEIIYVEPEVGMLSLRDGDLVVVQCNNDTEATFKQIIFGDTQSSGYFKPLNPDWPEQKMIPSSDCHLVGKVIGKFTAY